MHALKNICIIAIASFISISTAYAEIEQDAPLTCGSSETYYPRGDKWANDPLGTSYEYRIQSNGAPGLSLSTVKAAINASWGLWQNLECNSGDPIAINFTQGDDYPDYPFSDLGDNPEQGVYNHVIYFITDEDDWLTYYDESTIAVTSNLFFTDSSGYVLTADMEFNAVDQKFRYSGEGCTSSQSNCYDLQSIATHEFGHWIGFNHVACTDAVMYPTATNTTFIRELPDHEAVGACAVYNPYAFTSGSTAQWGEQCTDSSECPSGGECIVAEYNGFYYGLCSEECVSDSTCPDAYYCHTADTISFCRPGVREGSEYYTDDGSYYDMCVLCENAQGCASGLCMTAPDETYSACSMYCDPDATETGCPDNLECYETTDGRGACWPSNGDCESYETTSVIRMLNEVCYDPGYTDDEDDDTIHTCGSNLVCFVFLNYGECVNYCADSKACPGINQSCCYSINDYGQCQYTPSSSDQTIGGCFDLRSEGEYCIKGDESICEDGLLCANLDQSIINCDGVEWEADYSNDHCYKLCSDDSYCDIDNGQRCNLCLEVSSGIGICWPPKDSQKRALGYTCTKNDQCASEYCLDYQGQKVCSTTCSASTQTGCPTALSSELGLNFDCLSINNQGYCYPTTGPITYPETETEDNDSGCNCQSTSASFSTLFFALLCLGFLLRKRQYN